MRRKFFTLVSALSLLLCAGTVVLLVMSYLAIRPVSRPGVGFCLIRIDEGNEFVVLRPGRLEHWIFTPWDGKWYWEGGVSLWVVAAVCAVAGMGSRIVAARTPAQGRVGFCRSCGYDLACNTSGVCPECGTAVAGKVTT
ncbi:MAG TPA: hypothetical protein VIM11_02365 [Tepidisphaeraceae bacterium]